MDLIKKIGRFARREALLCIAAFLAVLSMILVPPSGAYLSYIDFSVLALLFCLMAVVAGFSACGLFSLLSERLLSGRKNTRILMLMLVLLPFFSSMLLTNDVALITFVPFTILVVKKLSLSRILPALIVLQTLAANLGSMATPVGNPQNLFLYQYYSLSAERFFSGSPLFCAESYLALRFCSSSLPRQKRGAF